MTKNFILPQVKERWRSYLIAEKKKKKDESLLQLIKIKNIKEKLGNVVDTQFMSLQILSIFRFQMEMHEFVYR